jgi:hypothetical protein
MSGRKIRSKYLEHTHLILLVCLGKPWRSKKSREEEMEQANSEIQALGMREFCSVFLITSITGWRFAIIVLFHRHV